MNESINIMDAPIAEFKTKKAAKNFAKRVLQTTIVEKSDKAIFDFKHKGQVYHVKLVEVK